MPDEINYDVFISYSRKDYLDENHRIIEGNIITKIKDAFINSGISFWFDEEYDGVSGGDAYMTRIANGIAESLILVFISSKNSNATDMTAGEIATAHLYKKKIIPFRLDDTPYNRSIIIKIAPLDYIDYFTNPEKAINELITSIKKHKEEVFGQQEDDTIGNNTQGTNTFETSRLAHCPEGAINGVFSVSPTKKVFFSRGNLQYQASNNRWRFAEHQYEAIGGGNDKISPYNNDWIDLFGWGTGNDPTKIKTWTKHYQEFVDWGNNNIINGGNNTAIWNTLTEDEWKYLFSRKTPSEIGFVKAQVNGVNGTILLPDNWRPDIFKFNAIGDCVYNNNIVDEPSWTKVLEENGAVFLPVTGNRAKNNLYRTKKAGYYWSSTPDDSGNAYCLKFFELWNMEFGFDDRSLGFAVRLVRTIL